MTTDNQTPASALGQPLGEQVPPAAPAAPTPDVAAAASPLSSPLGNAAPAAADPAAASTADSLTADADNLIAELSVQRGNHNAELDQTRAKLAEAESNLRIADAKAADQAQEIGALKQTNEQLNGNLVDAGSKINNAAAQVQTLQNEVATVAKQRDDATAAFRKLKEWVRHQNGAPQ